MPGSIRENDNDVIEFVKTHDIDNILDVGAGMGTYGKMLKPYAKYIDAVEVWQPYVDNYNLSNIYDIIHYNDVRNMNAEQFEHYDLVIFGDILEHMSRDDALAVWRNASTAKYGLISVPIIHYPQGAEYGNPYEVHVQEHLTPEDIRRDYGPFVFERVYQVTGTFIKEF